MRGTIDLSFCGAAGTVTGSCYWLRAGTTDFLVDCGMFQGSKTLKSLNYGAFPFDPARLAFVVLTHAHIDHSGLLPRLMRQGFAGPVHTTAGTRDLLAYMLPDSGAIQEMEVERLNRRNLQRGREEVAPIYTREHAEAALAALRPLPYETWADLAEGVRVRLWNAGHILGSASVEVEIATGSREQRLLRLLFSGDIGPDHKLFHPDPEGPDNLDYLICESTYGGVRRRTLTPERRREVLAREVRQALARGGNLLIPIFAVERTQELLLDLCALFDSGAIPRAQLFLDSPLAIRATEVFARHAGALEDLDGTAEPFRRPNIHFTQSVEASKAIARTRGGAIVLAGSGMCEAGRIRHHLKQNLWRRDATVLLVGFQAAGTLGSLLAAGAPAVRIQGEDVRVAATIRQLDIYSGHADGDQLVDWVRRRLPVKRAVFLTHGETERLAALRAAIAALGADAPEVVVPQIDDAYDLAGDGGGRLHRRRGPHRLAPEVVGGPDWHNAYADFTLTLRDRLEGMAEARDRDALLTRLRRQLERMAAE